MKIQLDYEIQINVQEGSATKESLVVFFREFTKQERKKQRESQDKFSKIYQKLQKLDKKQSSLTKKAELHELNGDYTLSLKCLAQNEKLDVELDKLVEELENIGGGNQDEFTESIAKDRFDKQVSGSDKSKLEVYAEIKGYSQLIRELDAAKAELEKKQSGE